MDSALWHDHRRYLRGTVEAAVKILIVGPFAVGKTTMVGALSEIPPLRTEETMTQAGATVDILGQIDGKDTTTVAMDFGRITLNDRLVLYLFGAPGQKRFGQLWDDLAHGALGALVLVDPRHLDKSFPVMDKVEARGLPYAVAVNQFDGAPTYGVGQLREALDLACETPLVVCDARERSSTMTAVINLVQYLIDLSSKEHA